MTRRGRRVQSPCPNCASLNTITITTLEPGPDYDLPGIRRSKECRDCGERFETIEVNAKAAANPVEVNSATAPEALD